MRRTPATFANFIGLDVRALADASDPRSARVATNLELTNRGGYTSRPGCKAVCSLSQYSVGLYAANGYLRSIIPGGQAIDLSAFGEVTVLYDPITSNTGTYNTGTAAMTQASTTITITGGTIPTNAADGGSFNTGSFTSRIVRRITATTMEVEDPWTVSALSGQTYTIKGYPAAHATGDYTKLAAAETYGASSGLGAFPYVVVYRSTTGKYEHHWIRTRPISNAVAVNTKIILPFTPGPNLISVAGKLWADDPANGVLRFSSVANGPTDWSERNDAGFLAVLNFINGSRDMTALGLYDGNVAVFFNDAIQLWAVNPNPALTRLVRVLSGPGTDYGKTVVNTLGDLFYFSQGGFRSLTTAAVSGQLVENDDIGSKIQPLTEAQDAPTYGPISLWSQTRGQYLTAFDDVIYCFRYNPKTKVVGWTTWELDFDVEYMVELDGKVYIRAANTVYRLDDDYDDGCEYDLQFQALDMKAPQVRKRWDFFRVSQSFQSTGGTVQVDHYLDPANSAIYVQGPRLSASTASENLIPVGAMSHTISPRFTGTGKWTIDRLVYEYTKLSF